MSVGSIGLVPVPVVANEYNAPKLKVNTKGQITSIEDINDEGQLDDLQATYDEYEADYQALLQAQTDIQSNIDSGNVLISINDTMLDTQEGIMTQDNTDLTTLIDSFVPFEYAEYNVMSNEVNSSSVFTFSNTDGNSNEQNAQPIFGVPFDSGFQVPSGNYLLSAFLTADVVGGDISKVINSGSGMYLEVFDTKSNQTLARFISGRTGSAFGSTQFSRGQVSGQQFITIETSETYAEIQLKFYCFAGAIVGQPSYENFALDWKIQPFSTIGSGASGDAGNTNPPTEYYKVLSFQKI